MKKSLNEKINEIELRKKGIAEGSDGLRRCLRCGAPLQRREIDRNGVVHLIDVQCRCRELRERKAIEDVRRGCFESPILSTYTYNSMNDEKIKPNPYLAKFIRKFGKIKEKAIGLYVCSGSDQSRTFNLARVANGLIDRKFKVKYITVHMFSNLRLIPNADYSELMKKLASFDAIAFEDLDLMCPDEKKLSFLYGVISYLISSGVILLISGDKHVGDVRVETYYGKKIKEIVQKKCVIIHLAEEINEVNPQQLAEKELWMFEDEDSAYEK